MSTYGSITSYIDVAQLTLYGFWLFFAGLIFYLRTEDKREGFPMESETTPGLRPVGFPPIPAPKAFVMRHGPSAMRPRPEPLETVKARPHRKLAGRALDAHRQSSGRRGWPRRLVPALRGAGADL